MPAPKTGEYRPLSARHFDTLHRKIHTNLDWAGKEGWTVHWARHHAKAQVSQIAGPDAARKLLGHATVETP